jgi:1,4-alpha-glucan branching enzyme
METNTPSTHTGMGATPYSEGTAFRVWAPNADAVHVAGTFNDWSECSHPLVQEGSDYWSLDAAGVTPGHEYKFIVTSKAGDKLWRTDPYARDVTSSVGNGVIVDPAFDWGGELFHMPPWSELVIYELHIGTFRDQPGGPPGTFESAIGHLGYLKDLGINCVQVMPSMEFAGGFSWGYNPAHLFAIEDDYGGPNALKKFVKAAHAQGIAVIFDAVYNHFGPSDLSLWRFDGWSKDGKGGIYFYSDWRSATPWGDTRPDYGRGEVRQFIRDNVLSWLEDTQVDGIRWDATAYIRNVYGNDNDPGHDIGDGWGLMQRINNEIDQRQPWKISIAEDLRGNAWITKDTGAGGAGFDAQWDSRFVHPVREAIITRSDHDRDLYAVRDAITHRYNGNAFQRVIYTESHDEVANGKARVPEEIWPGNAGSWYSKKRSTAGAALVFTAPGIPMIFQGQAFLEDEWFRDQDPLDWSKTARYAGIVQLYTDLIRLRRNWYDHTRGLRGQHVHVHHVNNNDKVLGFHRWDRGGPRDSVVVVVNLANRAYRSYNLGFPRGGLWKVRFNSDWSGYDREFGNHHSYDTEASSGPRDDMPCNANVGIGPYSVILLSQDG